MIEQLIPISQLEHSTLNPRKDFGELDQLANSILAVGLLQPLVVKPMTGIDGYSVIVGNRRLEAMRTFNDPNFLVRCNVVEENNEENIMSMMLVENINRQNMNALEEANGFQFMMDLGKSVEDISAATGFSKSTIHRRTKLNKLDADGFKNAVAGGMTLLELGEIADIENEEERAKVLKKAGTKDFRNALASAKERDKKDIMMKEIRAWVDTQNVGVMHHVKYENGKQFAYREEEPENKFPCKYRFRLSTWRDEVEYPTLEEGKTYFAIFSDTSCELYEFLDDGTLEEEAAKEAEREARQDEIEEHNNAIEAVLDRIYNLRLDFVKNIKRHPSKAVAAKIHKAVFDELIYRMSHYSYNASINWESVYKILDIENDEEFKAAYEDDPDYVSLVMVYTQMDGGRSYAKSTWNNEVHFSVYVNDTNEELDRVYALLETFGYKKSEEEEQIEAGTHEIFDTSWLKKYQEKTE